MPHERQEMNRNVSEINVQELRVARGKHAAQGAAFRAREICQGASRSCLKPKSSQEMRRLVFRRP